MKSRGGRPGLSIPNSPYVSVDLNQHLKKFRSCVRVGMDVPNRLYVDVKQHLKKDFVSVLLCVQRNHKAY